LVASTATTSPSEKKSENVFHSPLEEMKRDGLFNPVEIAALRLASARNDPELTGALAAYRNKNMNMNTFKRTILYVAHQVIQDVSVMDTPASSLKTGL
jgi:hypothetical protein